MSDLNEAQSKPLAVVQQPAHVQQAEQTLVELGGTLVSVYQRLKAAAQDKEHGK